MHFQMMGRQRRGQSTEELRQRTNGPQTGEPSTSLVVGIFALCIVGVGFFIEAMKIAGTTTTVRPLIVPCVGSLVCAFVAAVLSFRLRGK